MPFKASSVVDERTRFILDYQSGDYTMTELCEIYGISRETGYYWLRRYLDKGLEALQDRSRDPGHPNQTAKPIERAVLALRYAHMRWGPRKLKSWLEEKRSEERWPAASTIGALLKREGLVVARKKRRRAPPYTQPFAAAEGPNRVWCADFKGYFKTQDGARIDPLTISDAYSRYLLRCQQVGKTRLAPVRGIFEAAFREYGLPDTIRTDNGGPFATGALAGLSRLAVWWMKLGIVPERIAPGHPEQNGRHERMHRTLKEETASPPSATRRAQQVAFDRFRKEYNEERPHEALQMQTPSERYVRSEREYPARVAEPEYEEGMEVRRVQPLGYFSWDHRYVFLSGTLGGEVIGLRAVDERFYDIYFAKFPIGRLDSYKQKVLPLAKRAGEFAGEPGAGETSPSPAPHPLAKPTDLRVENPGPQPEQKASGMCPV